MALICCPECTKSISEAAAACPHCGFTLTTEIVAAQKQKQQAVQAGVGCAFGGIAVVLLLLCSGAFSSGGGGSNQSSDSYYHAEAQRMAREIDQQGYTHAPDGSKITRGMLPRP